MIIQKVIKSLIMLLSSIISDYDNERYIRNDVHSARVIYTRDYTNELIKNVVDALEKAFR